MTRWAHSHLPNYAFHQTIIYGLAEEYRFMMTILYLAQECGTYTGCLHPFSLAHLGFLQCVKIVFRVHYRKYSHEGCNRENDTARGTAKCCMGPESTAQVNLHTPNVHPTRSL